MLKLLCQYRLVWVCVHAATRHDSQLLTLRSHESFKSIIIKSNTFCYHLAYPFHIHKTICTSISKKQLSHTTHLPLNPNEKTHAQSKRVWCRKDRKEKNREWNKRTTITRTELRGHMTALINLQSSLEHTWKKTFQLVTSPILSPV